MSAFDAGKKTIRAEVSELKKEVCEMRQKMMEMEKMRRQKDGEEKLISESDLRAEVSSLRKEMSELPKSPTLGLEEKMLKLEGRTDTWFDFADCKYRKNIEQMQQLRTDIELEFKTFQTEFKNKMEKLERGINAMTTAREKAQIARPLIKQPITTSENNNAEFSLPDRFLSIPQMTCFNLVLRNEDFKPDFVWTIEKQQRTEVNVPLRSPIFTWTGCSFNAEITKAFVFSNAHLSLRMRSPQTLSTLPKPIPAFYCLLRDQTGSGRHKAQLNSFYALRPNHLIEFRADGVDAILDTLEDPTYNVNDALTIEIYIEPFSTAQMVYSYDGTLNWAVDKYGKRKQLAEEKLVWYAESPYFYTAPKGYRVKVLMLLDALEDGDYGVVALIRFIPGEFDDDLPRTFVYEASVTLLNRKEPHKSVGKRLKRNLRKGLECYVPLCKDQEVKDLVENDTLFYKVTIK